MINELVFLGLNKALQLINKENNGNKENKSSNKENKDTFFVSIEETKDTKTFFDTAFKEKLKKTITDLDSDDFEAREKASKELQEESIGKCPISNLEELLNTLKKEIKDSKSAEVKRRIEEAINPGSILTAVNNTLVKKYGEKIKPLLNNEGDEKIKEKIASDIYKEHNRNFENDFAELIKLRLLPDNSHISICNSMVKHLDKISEKTKMILIHNSTGYVQIKIAEHSGTTGALLKELANNDENWQARQAVAANKNTLPETLKKLSGDKDWAVKSVVAQNENASQEILENLANDNDVRGYVLLNSTTSEKILEKLADDKHWSVRQGVAKHKNVTKEILEKLSDDPDGHVRWGVAENQSPKITKFLEKLATDKYEDVRGAVARNKNTEEKILEKLAADKTSSVRTDAIKNPNTSEKLLKRLLEKSMDDKDSIRSSVAKNINATEEILKDLVNDKSIYVRICVAEHPNTTKELLKELVKDPDVRTKISVVQNPNTTGELLTELAKDPVVQVRVAVFKNNKTPKETLEKLARDKEVREYKPPEAK